MDYQELVREIKACRRCSLSKTRTNALPGEGDLNAKWMFVAQAPGEVEDREGRMFLGPSGKIFDELLHFARIKRKNIYMTNIIKCMLPGYRKPKQIEIDSCRPYLEWEINSINPEMIIPMGFYAIRVVFELLNILLKPKDEFHSMCGNLFFSMGRKAFPLEHPASVLYRPELSATLKEHYSRMRIFKKTCEWFDFCPMKRFYEQGTINRKWIELYCRGDWMKCLRYQMEKKGEYHSDRMLPDGTMIET